MFRKTAAVIVKMGLLLCLAAPVYASDLQIVIDEVVLGTEQSFALKEGTMMVPVRLIGEHLGYSVEWQEGKAFLLKENKQFVLEPGSDLAVWAEKTILLPGKTYLQKDRLIVPLRLFEKIDACSVMYKPPIIEVTVSPLKIAGNEVTTLIHEYHMTIGGVVQEILGNANKQDIYSIFLENRGERIEEPSYYSWIPNLDIEGAYYKNGGFDFMAADDGRLQSFAIYTLVKTCVSGWQEEQTLNFPTVVLHDVTEGQWYVFTADGRDKIIRRLESARLNGFIKIIRDSVV